MWPFPSKPIRLKIQTVSIEPFKLRLHQWQADPSLAGAAGKVLLEPTFRLMLQVAQNESPAMLTFTPDATLESRALHQARTEGYNLALKNLEAMALHTPLAKELEATFETEERPE